MVVVIRLRCSVQVPGMQVDTWDVQVLAGMLADDCMLHACGEIISRRRSPVSNRQQQGCKTHPSPTMHTESSLACRRQWVSSQAKAETTVCRLF